MSDFDILQSALQQFSGMDATAFKLSETYWKRKNYQKGEFYNEYKNVCKHLGFILDGIFRTYYINEAKGEEKNVFFFSQHQVVVSYKSFLDQAPCNYYTASLTSASVLYIHINDLNALYQQSHQWEHFGRMIGETGFRIAMTRAEDFLFLSPEQRYLNLVEQHPDIFSNVPLYHIASYLGIQGPSLSRIRKRMMEQGK